MAAVVDDDLHRPELRHHRIEEAGVGLAADAHEDAVLLERGAGGIDVEADNARVRAEIAAPHLQRAARAASDLHQRHRLLAEPREMPLIGREVVRPFVDAAARVREEMRPQIVHPAPSAPATAARAPAPT